MQAIAFNDKLAIAVQHYLSGDDQAAIQLCRQILDRSPGHAEAHHLLGIIAQRNGRNDTAVAHFQQAIEANPQNAEFHNSLAVAQLELGEIDSAVASCQRALELDPAYAEAHLNLGNARRSQGRSGEAVACYESALQLKPDSAGSHYNLGTVWFELRNFNAAAACFQHAIALQPAFAAAHNNLGAAYREVSKLESAITSCRMAIQLRPDSAAAHVNLGLALADAFQPYQALASFEQAVQLNHDSPQAQYCLANLCRDLGRLDEAVDGYRRALKLRPDDTPALCGLVHAQQYACQWHELETLSRRLLDIVDDGTESIVSPLALISAPLCATPRQQLQCARRWAKQQLQADAEDNIPRVVNRLRPAGAKFRIGYLSADFRAHAVSYLAVELFENHDRTRFDVFGYSYGPDDGSPMRLRLTRAFDQFVDISGHTHAEAARRIAADEIDLLIDLTGYTRFARSQILALRPAPIQINYLGYPATMGAPFVDYIIVDHFVVPANHQPCFTEQLIPLTGCYQVNSRRRVSDCVRSRGDYGLPDKAFVFCAFNSSHKITPAVFDIWMGLLRETPGSVLWLLERNRFVRANLCREALARRVAPHRLIFAPHLPLGEHLGRYRQADLFLDTFPYGGHTTASDALWIGCPVLTLVGETFASRVGGSLLQVIGLPELIASSLMDYRDRALQLAHNQGQLAALRARLQVNRESSGLFDAAAFTKKFEAALIGIWESHSARLTR